MDQEFFKDNNQKEICAMVLTSYATEGDFVVNNYNEATKADQYVLLKNIEQTYLSLHCNVLPLVKVEDILETHLKNNIKK